MSYSILYRSMFVKMSNGKYIPMMEMGDNNVWDCSYGRGCAKRSRSWCNINIVSGKIFYSHEDLMFDDPNYLENNAFSTSHQSVNVYGLPERRYEVRTEDNAVDVQIQKRNDLP